jgi:imidazoleglycerol-phosphate dehydratase
MSRIERRTGETTIELEVRREGEEIRVATGDGFLDHMVNTLARYAGLALRLEATGDLRHHLVEDVAITLGLALAAETPSRAERFGWAVVPMDEALVQAAVDLGGRPYYVGRLPSNLYEHFLQSLAVNMRATLHVRVLRGRDRHHVVEAAVKATGLALRQALREGDRVFSTKGSVSMELEVGGSLAPERKDTPGADEGEASGSLPSGGD